jgi:hypothetical protein
MIRVGIFCLDGHIDTDKIAHTIACKLIAEGRSFNYEPLPYGDCHFDVKDENQESIISCLNYHGHERYSFNETLEPNTLRTQ